jgi:hypothetical protein
METSCIGVRTLGIVLRSVVLVHLQPCTGAAAREWGCFQQVELTASSRDGQAQINPSSASRLIHHLPSPPYYYIQFRNSGR